MKHVRVLCFLLLLASCASAEFTIHIINPWMNDTSANRRDSLRMVGNSEVNYYPGSAMQSEGSGWFFWVYTTLTTSSHSSFKLTTWVGPQTYIGQVTFGRTFWIDSLFATVGTDVEEIWVIPNADTTKAPGVYTTPPEGKVINILNPWPENSSKIIIGGNAPVQMRVREDLCGWYRYYYAGPVDSLNNVTFTDYFETEKYTASGLSSGAGIDLRSVLKTRDTVYILPQPFPAGAPKQYYFFPGRLGDCNTRKVSGVFRDWALDNISFFNQISGLPTGAKGMVKSVLTSENNYKPVLTDDPSINVTNSTKLGTWFNTITFANGQDNDTCVDLTMTKSYDGRWTLDSDKMGGFFPIDSFVNPNNIQYNDAYNKKHNFHFTMEMHMQFVYNQGQDLQFAFCGDDDVWIFVNNRLAIDLGGLHDRAKDTLWLDKKQSDLGLVDGETYNMDIFFAERNPVGSNLLIQTTMDLRNSGELYYKENVVADGTVQYDIWQQVQTESNDCGLTRLTDGEELSSVEFYIEGPSFSEATLLTTGIHYGGINVESSSRVTIDSASIVDLMPGEYRITFISTYNKDRSGYLVFVVLPTPDHVDLMPNSTVLDLNADAKIDSVHMGIEEDSLLLYAVIRDKYQTYIEDGTGLTWRSSDESILKVTPILAGSANAWVEKTGGGTVWIIASKDGLKADSILFTVEKKPVWPLIASARMTDSKGDLVPDLLNIVLSDTFKAGQTLTSVVITYSGKQYTVAGSACTISGMNLSVPFVTLTGSDTKPSGSATIVIDVSGTEQTHTGSFTDGVGPALKSAEVLEKDGSELDILYLTFSEPVDPSTVSGANLLLIKQGTTDTIKTTVLHVNNVISDSVISVSLASSANPPIAGDSLRLVAGVNLGTVTDANNNQPHLLNQSVEITLRKGAAGIVNAWYLDENADGVLDAVQVRFRRAVDVSEFDTATLELNMVKYTVDAGKFTKVSDSVIAIPVKNTVGASGKIVTSGSMYLSQRFRSVSTVRIVSVADSAAPVITLAKLLRGGYKDDGSLNADTLQVTFSENIQNASSAQFQLLQKETIAYRFDVTVITVSANKGTYLVSSVEPSTVNPLKGDSIWIGTGDPVSDTSGVAQTNEKNRRVALDVVQPQTTWSVKTGPNPLDLTKNTVMTVKAVSKKNIDMSAFTAQVQLFDAIGDEVVKADMKFTGKEFEYSWNGNNSKGRLVGAGTYSGFVTVFENGIKVLSQSVKLGVKR